MNLDVVLLFIARGVRLFAFGCTGVVLALYLNSVGLSDDRIGLLLYITLVGDAGISLLVTLFADAIGRKRMLLLGCMLKLLGAAILSYVHGPMFWLLVAGCTIGVISPSGNEVGPFLALEQSVLADQVKPSNRTMVFAWYSFLGSCTSATGSLVTGFFTTWLVDHRHLSQLDAYRIVFVEYGGISILLMALVGMLSQRIERAAAGGVAGRGAPGPPALEGVTGHAYGGGSDAELSRPLLFDDEQRDSMDSIDLESDQGQQRVFALKKVIRQGGSGSPQQQAEAAGAEGGGSQRGRDERASGSVSAGRELLERASTGRQLLEVVSPRRRSLERQSSVGRELLERVSTGRELLERAAPGKMIPLGALGGGAEHPQQQPISPTGLPGSCEEATAAAASTEPGQHRLVRQPLLRTSSKQQQQQQLLQQDGVFTVIYMPADPVKPAAAAAAAVAPGHGPEPKGLLGLSRQSQRTVLHLCALFVMDSFASGMITGSLLAYYFQVVWDLPTAQLGAILFGANLIGGISSLASGWVAGRLGLVNTMVFTHLPSNVFLILVPFMPNVQLAVTMVFLRFSISQMDVVPRQSYVSGVVAAEERTATMGITNIVRSLGAACGPLVTGWLAAGRHFGWAFVVSGVVQITYDLALLWSFRRQRAEHEKQGA